MEMNINSKLIRFEREKRAWSQEHLATVAGLGLRTIQRIETTGTASYETAKAIAAIFEMDVQALKVKVEKPRTITYWNRRYAKTLAASAILGLSALYVSEVLADQVMLDVGLTLNDQKQGIRQLITEEGKDAEIRVEGQLKLIIVPTINSDGGVTLATRIFEFDGSKFVLISEPKLVTKDDKDTEIRLSSDRGNNMQISIKPHKI